MTSQYRGPVPQERDQAVQFMRREQLDGVTEVTGHTYERLIDNVKAQLRQLNQTLNVLETHKRQALNDSPPAQRLEEPRLPSWRGGGLAPPPFPDEDDFYKRKYSQPPPPPHTMLMARSRNAIRNTDYPTTVNYPAVMANRGKSIRNFKRF